MKPANLLFATAYSMLLAFCSNNTQQPSTITAKATNLTSIAKRHNPGAVRTIHILVALCDNKYQGIVPVGKSIGNGQDPENNLYWGCGYGIKTFFRQKSSDWIFLQGTKNVSPYILERMLLKHKTANVYLLADAYDGQFIKQTTLDFFADARGKHTEALEYKNDSIYFGGASNLLAYVGHDGLMDFELPVQGAINDTVKKEAMILACYSKNYFAPQLKQTSTTPLLWTTGLMAPEAYTLYDAISSWIKREPAANIAESAAKAYSKYQKCSVKAAKKLLVTGW